MPSRLRRYDEYGHVHFLTISCFKRLPFFRHDVVKSVLIDGMATTREKLGIRWLAYVVMPEHVHVLVFPMPVRGDEPVPISTVLQHLKQYVGRHGKQALRGVWVARRTLGNPQMDRWATGDGPKPFWKTRGHDFNITTERALRVKMDYVHKNPITRGMVERAEDWPWSSYRFYEFGDSSSITMDWDGAWPIV